MIKGEQIIQCEHMPYSVDGRKKPLWVVLYTYSTDGTKWRIGQVVIDNPTLRRLERFKIERHKHNYLAEIINRVKE